MNILILVFSLFLADISRGQLYQVAGKSTKKQPRNDIVKIGTMSTAEYIPMDDSNEEPADAEICRELIGTWWDERDSRDYLTFEAEGNFVSQNFHSQTNSVFKGTWHVKSGILAIVTTNIFGPGTGGTIHAKVIRITDRDLIYEVLDDPHLQPYTVSLKRTN